MKRSRLLFAALIIGTAASCVKEANSPDRSKRPVEVVLEASWEDDSETKTHRVDDAKGTTMWDDGDQISLFFGNGADGGSCFTTAQGGETASFSGVLNAFTAGGEGYAGETTYFWGVYPYNATTTCDNNSVTVNIPSVQPGRAGTYGPGVNVSVGRSENLKMGFYNVCSGFRFSVTIEGITGAMFRSNDDAPIVGDATVQFINGKPEVTSLVNTSSEVLLIPEGGVFEVGQKYFLEFIPSTFAEGFSVTLYDDKGMEATYVYGKSIAFTRSNFSGVSDINTKSGFGEWTVRRGNIAFADPYFKEYCVENFDTDQDGEISYAEAAEVTEVDCSGTYVERGSISSLEGIQYFPSLTVLSCEYNQISSLDISRNVQLERLDLKGNALESIDVSRNTALEFLDCGENQLAALEVSSNTNLTVLNCQSNQLTDLDVSKNADLIALDCSANQLASLDVRANVNMKQLGCASNQLTALDISRNVALINFACGDNQLTNLDVSRNTALSLFVCAGNQLTGLDFTRNTALTSLYCGGNRLTELDLTRNTALTSLHCGDNQITSLDISRCAALRTLDCRANLLTDLDLSGNSELLIIYCMSNRLTTLDVSNNISLRFLQCSPMNDENGVNLLETLYIFNGQVIMYITENRNSDIIPDGTVVTDTHPGTGEGTGDDEIDDDTVHEYVDLGLPSGTMWATCNIGAGSPEECGDYFAWGETQTKENYVESTYFDTKVAGYSYVKYYLNGGKTVLDPEDDAASVRWGGEWHMPTSDQLQELLNNCTWTFYAEGNSEFNGVPGYKIQGNKSGYTDKFIFIPASGYKEETNVKEVGISGSVWTSTIYARSHYTAQCLSFDGFSYGTNANPRERGLAIRPVCPKQHEYVDLGLSVKWATYNVGANSTDENGDYFAWGGTEPLYSSLSPLIWNTNQPGGYDWSNYSLCNGSSTTITKYTHADGQTASSWYKNGSFIGDDKAVLDSEDDAASVNWGGDWRMPTKDEIEELMDNCTCGLAYIDGKYYSKFTSKKPGYTDKYILFPYAGAFLSNYLQYVSANAGRAYCWSSSKPVGIAYDSDSAYYLHTTDGRASVSRNYRCYGMTVRAVLP